MKLTVIIASLLLFLSFIFGGVSKNCDAQQKTVKASASAKTSDDDFFTVDFNTALAKAKKENKPVFIDFYTDWCGWCKKMDKDTYTDPGIKKQIKEGWVAIKLNAEDESKKGTFNGKSMTYPEIGQYFQVRGYPSFLFIDKEGKAVTVVPGYFPKQDFALVLRYFKEELYTKKVDLKRYIEKNK
jgi:thioredoxin-related protein